MKGTRTWVVVANSTHARFLLNDGPGHGLVEIRDLDLKQDHLDAHDLAADRSGRTFDSNGPSKHAMEPSRDLVRLEEKKFAGKVAVLLENKLKEDCFDRLILVAAPTTLGDIREALPNHVAKRVAKDVPKNLNHIPNAKLTGYIGKFLAV
ncbi:MAG: host attachment protein [Sneathiella sp.]|uniref:host attachment protein n=1 Tax=Sneathiella sp. TaxID=1964365 RepID=UPI0030026264